MTDTISMAPIPEDRHRDLDLAELGSYPALAECVRLWRQACRDGELPAALPAEDVPAAVKPYTMLLDYLPERRDARVRMVGNYVGERADFETVGRNLRGYFNDEDAQIVYAGLERAATTREPSLARRDYVTIEGKRFRYVRLILPLASDGRNVDGFFKTIEPSTLIAS
ncbi:MAG: hypothetical protein J0H39_17710 [Alphaproteobacteria bacterium]|nr:hypothetical protein [Alphaproteobacteria bacterium]